MRSLLLLTAAFTLITTAALAESKVDIQISGPQGETISQTRSRDDDEHWANVLANGRDKLSGGASAIAVSEYLNPIIAHYEKTYADSPSEIFCADDQKVALFYLLSAAVASDLGKEEIPENLMPKVFAATGRDTRKPKKETIVLPSTWAEAYYLKSYAFVEMGKIEEAQKSLKKALRLSPCNATYWHELGHTHQLLKNWDSCLKAFQLGEEAADFSSEDQQNHDKARAWRGIGFVLVELGKLDEAEAKYKQCLELDPNDDKAKAELNYIKGLREQEK